MRLSEDDLLVVLSMRGYDLYDAAEKVTFFFLASLKYHKNLGNSD